MNTEVSHLNTLYKKWWQEPEISRPGVDCGRCSRADLSASARWQAYKCCTFQPFVNCVLLGAMLEDGFDPLNVREDRAIRRPLGIMPTRQFRRARDRLPEDQHGEAQLCSYYDLSSRCCRVWSLRPGECSVHYCVSNAQRTQLSEEVFQFEAGIAQMALAHLGFSPAEIEVELAFLNDEDELKAAGRKVPSDGLSREEAREIYLASWEWIKTVPEVEVQSWQRFDILTPKL
jgi:hypothetical protein